MRRTTMLALGASLSLASHAIAAEAPSGTQHGAQDATLVAAAELSEADSARLAENPSLQALYERDPEAGAEMLRRIDEALEADGPTSRALSTAGDEEQEILDANPAIEEVYRVSPEAALDIIRLIREAVKD